MNESRKIRRILEGVLLVLTLAAAFWMVWMIRTEGAVRGPVQVCWAVLICLWAVDWLWSFWSKS